MINSDVLSKRSSWQRRKFKLRLQKSKVDDSQTSDDELSADTFTGSGSLNSSCSSLPALFQSSFWENQESGSLKGCLKKTTSCTQGVRRQQRSVAFDQVHVREFPVCIGDSPSVSSGVPISIGWEPVKEESYKLIDHLYQGYQRKSDEKAQPFTAMQRFCLCKLAGYPTEDIIQAQKDARSNKRDRALTIQKFHMDPIDEAIEKMGRGTWNAIFARRRKREERKVLQLCRASDSIYLQEAR